MFSLIEFVASMLGSRAIEIVATILGLINVVLIVRRSIWNYPFGIAMVALYFFIFAEAKLYADAGLQIYYVAIQAVGLYWWLSHRDDGGLVIVERSPAVELLACAAGAVLVAAGLGWWLFTHTDAAAPYWDSAVAALSVVAQYLLSRRRLESWAAWIMVDVLAIGLYFHKGLYPTAALYAVFLGLAVAGLWRWSVALRNDQAVA